MQVDASVISLLSYVTLLNLSPIYMDFLTFVFKTLHLSAEHFGWMTLLCVFSRFYFFLMTQIFLCEYFYFVLSNCFCCNSTCRSAHDRGGLFYELSLHLLSSAPRVCRKVWSAGLSYCSSVCFYCSLFLSIFNESFIYQLCFSASAFFLPTSFILLLHLSATPFIPFLCVYRTLFVSLVLFCLVLSHSLFLNPSLLFPGSFLHFSLRNRLIDFIFIPLAVFALSHKQSALPPFKASIDHCTANHNQSPQSVIICSCFFSFVVPLSCIVCFVYIFNLAIQHPHKITTLYIYVFRLRILFALSCVVKNCY